MKSLDGRIVIVTGAGRGLGREHALLLASEGAKVVVNDLGGSPDGSGRADGPAQEVVDEIVSLGGVAVANGNDIADFEGARDLIKSTVEMFGDLHAVVNNAGILRDRVLVNMDDADWDAVMRVHLRGTFAVTRWATDYWRQQSKTGASVDAAVVNTSSTSGIFGNPGQTNYGAAKAGIACFSIIAALELQRYGVRVNCIAPAARTRLTEATPGLDEVMKAPRDGSAFDEWDPANVSPLVAYLVSSACSLTGQTFAVMGGLVQRLQPWSAADFIKKDGRWTVDELHSEMPTLSVGEWVDPSRALGV